MPRNRTGRFLDTSSVIGPRLTLPPRLILPSSIKRNNKYFTPPTFESDDPTFVLNGDSTATGNNIFQMFSTGDPSYVGTLPVTAGVAMGKTAAGNVFQIIPRINNNTVIAGSDTSMADLNVIAFQGWRLVNAATFALIGSNYLASIRVINIGGVAVAVQIGTRLYHDSGQPGNTQLASLTAPQYGARISFNAVIDSQSLQWSFSISDVGTNGGLVVSGAFLWQDFWLKIDTASSKAAAQVGIVPNG